MSDPQVPSLEMNDGHTIPQIGFGVYRVDPRTTERIVTDALEVGYRHIDTAQMYGNESGVGRAIANSGIDRSDIFVTTKVWPDDSGVGNPAPEAFRRSLSALGTDYVDLYLIHWPIMSRGALEGMWGTFQELKNEGLVRSIGVSNFTSRYLRPLIDLGQAVPAVNQLELQPAYQQRATIDFGNQYGIVPEAWGPLGQGRVDFANSIVGDIAERHGKTWAQVVLRWAIQVGHVVIPKSNHRERMIENISVVDFSLTDEEMSQISSLDDPNFPAINPDNY